MPEPHATDTRAASYVFVGGEKPITGEWPWVDGTSVQWVMAECDYCQASPRTADQPHLCYGCLLQWAYIGPQYEETANG